MGKLGELQSGLGTRKKELKVDELTDGHVGGVTMLEGMRNEIETFHKLLAWS